MLQKSQYMTSLVQISGYEYAGKVTRSYNRVVILIPLSNILESKGKVAHEFIRRETFMCTPGSRSEEEALSKIATQEYGEGKGTER